MPAGLGLDGTGRQLRNFVKELVHKITCGNSPEKTANINGDLFDASSGVYHGAVNYVAASTADEFMAQNIDVGVLGVTTSVDAMPATGGANLPGTFRVGDINGIQKGSIVHVVESTGAVFSATGGITFAGGGPTGVGATITITLTNAFTGVVTVSAALAVAPATATADVAGIVADAVNNDPDIGPLVNADDGGGVVEFTALQPGTLGNMTVTNVQGGAWGGIVATNNNLGGGAPNVGIALVSHVHRSGSITIQNWVTDPDFTFLAGSLVIASASGSPMEALVDTKVSSSAGASFVSGQYIAALLRACEDVTVSGGVVNPTGGGLNDGVTFGIDLDATAQFVPNSMIGNTLTFTDPTVTPDLSGFSTIITGNTATTVSVDPPLPTGLNPAAGDTFVLTATQLDGFLDQLNASPAEAGRAVIGGIPIGPITESANTGAPADNSNVAPVAALAYAASMRFGMLLTNNNAVEPNVMLQDQILSDLRGAEMPSSFPHVPLVTGVDAAVVPTTLQITLPANVGDRSTPRSGTFRIQQDVTTAGAPDIITHPTVNLAGIPFTRTGDTLTFTGWGPALGGGDHILPGARVFLMTGAMNGPKKHGYASEVSSTMFLNVLSGVLENILAYTVPRP